MAHLGDVVAPVAQQAFGAAPAMLVDQLTVAGARLLEPAAQGPPRHAEPPGARAFWLDNDFWVDLVGAARVRAELTENIGVVVSGDYGGFDIGSSSHRTWSLTGYASYRLGEHWDLAAGWRTLSIERGAVDVDMAGPLVGASYGF